MASRNLEAYWRLVERAKFDQDLTSGDAFDAMIEASTPDVEIHEPMSLPQGGVHVGHDAWRTMHHTMRELWDQKVEIRHVWDVPEDDVLVLYTDMEWTAKATGRTIRFPVVETLWYRDGLICKIEIFHQDQQAILETLEPLPSAAATDS